MNGLHTQERDLGFVKSLILSLCHNIVWPEMLAPSFRDAMFLSTGNGLRIMAAFVIPAIPLMGIGYVVSEFIDDPGNIVALAVWEITAYAVMTTTICVISVIYRLLANLDYIEEAT